MIPERIVDNGDGMAILIRFEGTGRQGIETTMQFINTIEIRDGLASGSTRSANEEAIRRRAWTDP